MKSILVHENNSDLSFVCIEPLIKKFNKFLFNTVIVYFEYQCLSSCTHVCITEIYLYLTTLCVGFFMQILQNEFFWSYINMAKNTIFVRLVLKTEIGGKDGLLVQCLLHTKLIREINLIRVIK